jgi:hypothetical protein
VRHLVLTGLTLLAALAFGCISEEQEVELGPVENIAGLVGASAQAGGDPPVLLAGASPRLSRSVTAALGETKHEVQAVLRVLIGADGEPFGVKVLETNPSDLAVAQEYAEALSQAVWKWEYEAARRNNTAVKGYLDLKFQYSGAPTEEGSAEP